MFSMFSVLHNYHLLSESLNNVVVMLEGIYLSAGLGMLFFSMDKLEEEAGERVVNLGCCRDQGPNKQKNIDQWM